jgi:hypothetical protein
MLFVQVDFDVAGHTVEVGMFVLFALQVSRGSLLFEQSTSPPYLNVAMIMR